MSYHCRRISLFLALLAIRCGFGWRFVVRRCSRSRERHSVTLKFANLRWTIVREDRPTDGIDWWCGCSLVRHGTTHMRHPSGSLGLRRFCGSTTRSRRSSLRWRLFWSLRGRRRFFARLLLLELRHVRVPLHGSLVNIKRNHGRGRERCCRNQGNAPASPPCPRPRNRVPPHPNFCTGGVPRQRHNLPAAAACSKMLEHLPALFRVENLLGKRAQRFRVGMHLVLAAYIHCRIHSAACSLNASVCEFCRSFFRFTSTSRGSAPSASSAARLLNPPCCRFLSTCFLVPSVARCSLRLTVAS